MYLLTNNKKKQKNKDNPNMIHIVVKRLLLFSSVCGMNWMLGIAV